VRQVLFAYEPYIRLGAFAGVLSLMGLWELFRPRRSQSIGRDRRWPGNLGVVAIDTVLVRILFPTAAVGLALIAEARGWGLFNAMGSPLWVSIPLGVILLDLIIYLQHVLFHAVPALWRLHRMHHADLDFDVTTGVRFHPIEILLSMLIKLGAVAALGTPAIAVLIFEVLLNATSMFSHGNVGLPSGIDRLLRWIVVTPDMHRVHHSIHSRETNSNFGFNLPWWDRLFGTYRAQPAAGHDAMIIGIEQFRDPREQRLDRMLSQPFREGRGSYPFGSDGPLRWIEVDELAARLQQKGDVAVVDVRGTDEFAGTLGHIAGARNVPLTELRSRFPELRQLSERRIVLVCHTDKRSASAAALLEDAGFSDVAVLRGGMERWNQKRLPAGGDEALTA
jgi:sterol desaturase/sphingolipid hydroxylase (fatty acid hydroxylase superfamily)/rhodanese-related sulfurtransferase